MPTCCADLPRTLTTDLHQHELTLRAPPRHGSGDGHRGSTCLRKPWRRKRWPADAWSYQCQRCKVHLCLACLADEGGEQAPHAGRRRREGIIEIVGCMGTALGTFVYNFGCACIGNPAAGPNHLRHGASSSSPSSFK